MGRDLENTVLFLCQSLLEVCVLKVAKIHHLFGHYFVIVHGKELVRIELIVEVILDFPLSFASS